MHIWQSIVLGLVEGITEYLPVSSTGHLIIAGDLMKLDRPETKQSLDAFLVVIQGGAILAVLGLYFPRFLQMLRGLLGKDRDGLRLFINIVIAFLPAAIIGFRTHDWIEEHLFNAWPVIGAQIVGGVYMIGVEMLRRARAMRAGGVEGAPTSGKDITQMTPIDALKIGLLQVLAMWPGTSRSMMTITGGYFAGLRPAAAAEFSFLLGMPTLLAATGLALAKDLWKSHKNHTPNMFESLGVVPIAVGIAVAAVSAAIAVKWLVGFLNRHGLVPFGIYRIVFGLALIGLVLAKLVTVSK